jgi:hypothetical protein
MEPMYCPKPESESQSTPIDILQALGLVQLSGKSTVLQALLLGRLHFEGCMFTMGTSFSAGLNLKELSMLVILPPLHEFTTLQHS